MSNRKREPWKLAIRPFGKLFAQMEQDALRKMNRMSDARLTLVVEAG